MDVPAPSSLSESSAPATLTWNIPIASFLNLLSLFGEVALSSSSWIRHGYSFLYLAIIVRATAKSHPEKQELEIVAKKKVQGTRRNDEVGRKELREASD